MSEERLKEIKDSIILQKIACKGNKKATELVNEELELYNEVVRLRKIFYNTIEYCNNNIESSERLVDVIDMLNEDNLTIEQLTGIVND